MRLTHLRNRSIRSLAAGRSTSGNFSGRNLREAGSSRRVLGLGRAGRAVLVLFVAIAGLTVALHLRAAEKARIQTESYQIEAVLTPQTHRLAARAKITFTALDDISVAVFELHNGLRPTRVTDSDGKALSAERVTQDSTIRIALPNGLQKGQTSTLTIDYEGVLNSPDDSPVPGLKLASVADPVSYLLYAGRWFPVVDYGVDRFTANVRVSVPNGYTVIGSGSAASNAPAPTATASAAQPAQDATAGKTANSDDQGAPTLQRRTAEQAKAEQAAQEAKSAAATKAKTPARSARTRTKGKAGAKAAPAQAATATRLAIPAGYHTFTFNWERASFPGTIIAGRFQQTNVSEGGATVNVYFLPEKSKFAQEYGDTVSKEFGYFTTIYGPPQSSTLKVVQLPDDTVPSYWAPEMVAIAGRAISEKTNYRLLANTVARQWWGVQVSPASRNDFWIADGGARYSEARYVEFAAGRAGAEEAVKDMAVGALAYESVPLSQIGSMDPFDPVFQSMSTDKGGVVFHMLRWVLGDQKFDQTMRTLLTQFAGKPISLADFRQTTEQVSGEQMTWFFSQWLESTGAPEFKNKYTIFRTNKGFRVVGEIAQDLDLFRMPVELKIDTDGQTETKRIDVVGTNSSYTIETFGKPRRIVIDPNNWVLKNSAELRLRTAIMRGQQLVAQGNLAESLREFQKALEQNKNSSLAHYRIAEVFYLQRNYQAAANSYRDSLNGDGEPRWTEVWSHIQLGKIFDITGQRERAVNEYRQALQTNDNTQGALDAARQYLQTPYARDQENKSGS